MRDLYAAVSATAGRHHGAISTPELDRCGVTTSLRAKWVRARRLRRVGPRSWALPAAPRTQLQAAWCAAADVAGFGHVAGRTAAWLHGLDGVRCLHAERLILESHHFEFTTAEIENAIDSAVRTRRIDEKRLREQACVWVPQGSGGAAVRAALLDTGGESRLERWFLAIVRTGGLPRPTMRLVVRGEGDRAARLDASFPGGLVVELEGHATHSSRRQRQHDEERRTSLTLAGYRVIVFTYNDVRDRPNWVLSRVRAALALAS